MKRFITCLLLMCSMLAFAQNTMVVHTKNGITKFQIEELDSITFVTDTLLEQTPQGTLTEENFYNDENNVKSVIFSIYSSLAKYVSCQRQVEGIYCIPLLCEDGQVYPLYATDGSVNNLWKLGYQTISRANNAIRILSGMDGDFAKEALAHALVIRSFVYYNMSMLWGTIPYVDENVDVMSSEPQVQVLTQSEILQKLLSDDIMSLCSQIRNGNAFVDDDHRLFEYGSLHVLLAEIHLTCQNLTEAGNLLRGETQILNVDCSETFPIRDYVNVYTDYYIDLLKSETRGQIDWPLNNNDYYWGVWAAHKRTGVALKKILELHPEYPELRHRLLLPIPKDELKMIPNLKQNEGYEN